MHWQISATKRIDLITPCIMAILNVTPDSFFDGDTLLTPQHAADAAQNAADSGADVLDIGGESTRPGAKAVTPAQQIRRIVPAIHAIRARPGLLSIPITIDTTSAQVAKAALDAGADAINDTSAGLDDPAMLPLAAARSCGIILMHRLITPAHDDYSDQYEDPPQYPEVVATVRDFLAQRAQAALAAGIHHDSIVLDPGLGFGKTVQQNLDLVTRTDQLTTLGYPILSALSRKSFIGRITLKRDSVPAERLAGTLAFSSFHLFTGASIFRVHDVADHIEALRNAQSIPW